MRPLKDLFIEEYWDIAYRFFDENDSVIDGKSKKFNVLKSDKRCWYADPFLFEKDGKTYLFVEMFDNMTEVGIIGCSEFDGEKFSEPVPVLKEKFHLSYPLVFEENGKVYMMPETHEDGCVQLYEAAEFPYKWKKSRVILKTDNAVDTVILDGKIIVSKVTDPPQMKTRLEIYSMDDGCVYSSYPASEESQIKRGAGRIFTSCGKTFRPAQNCSGAFYGRGIVLYEIRKFNDKEYTEEKTGEIKPENILAGSPAVCGTHTYARTEKIEVVDIKRKRFNLRRLLWIIKRKI